MKNRKITIMKKTEFTSFFSIFPLLACFSLLIGCGQLKYFQTAQDDFNAAATTEIRTLLNQADPEIKHRELERLESQGNAEVLTATTTADPEALYTQAYKNLQKALENETYVLKLKNDKVLGNVYTLKALCEWKLQKWQEAGNSAEKAFAELEQDGIEAPRDRAAMKAMPALVAIDQAYYGIEDLRKELDPMLESITPGSPQVDSIFDNKLTKHYQKFFHNDSGSGKIEAALKKIDEVRAQFSNRTDVQFWLLSSQLASLAIWQRELAYFELVLREKLNHPASAQWRTKQSGVLDDKIKHYKDLLRKMVEKTGQGNDLWDFWNDKI
jgi:tetratricopeptide (TPR) repeat protein